MAQQRSKSVVTTKKVVSIKGPKKTIKTQTKTSVKQRGGATPKTKPKPKPRTKTKTVKKRHHRKNRKKAQPEPAPPKIIIKRIYERPKVQMYSPPPPPQYYPPPQPYYMPPQPQAQAQPEPEPEPKEKEQEPETEPEAEPQPEPEPPAEEDPDKPKEAEDVKHKNPHKWRNRFLIMGFFIMVGIVIGTQTGDDSSSNNNNNNSNTNGSGNTNQGGNNGGVVVEPKVVCTDYTTPEECKQHKECLVDGTGKCQSIVCSNFHKDATFCNNSTNGRCFHYDGVCLDKKCDFFDGKQDLCESVLGGHCVYRKSENKCIDANPGLENKRYVARIVFGITVVLYWFLYVGFWNFHGFVINTKASSSYYKKKPILPKED